MIKGILSISTFLLFISIFMYTISTPLFTKEIETHVKVDDYVGVNLDTDKLYFGTISSKSVGSRSLTITSDTKAAVHIKLTGDIGTWMTSDAKNIFIENGSKNVQFAIRVPENTAHGNYTGEIRLIFYRPLARYLFLDDT